MKKNARRNLTKRRHLEQKHARETARQQANDAALRRSEEKFPSSSAFPSHEKKPRSVFGIISTSFREITDHLRSMSENV